jgi:glucose-6-phosphate 1-dehydrogenase
LERADCLVLFGATGNLARKKLFPALYQLESRHQLSMPVVGVAIDDWSDAELVDFVRASVRAAVDDVDEGALTRLTRRVRYVAGDYQDSATFHRLAGVVGTGCRPVH